MIQVLLNEFEFTNTVINYFWSLSEVPSDPMPILRSRSNTVVSNIIKLCLYPNNLLRQDFLDDGVIYRGSNYLRVLDFINDPTDSEVLNEFFEHIIGQANFMNQETVDIYNIMEKSHNTIANFLIDSDVCKLKDDAFKYFEENLIRTNDLMYLLFAAVSFQELYSLKDSVPSQEYKEFLDHYIFLKKSDLENKPVNYYP